MSTEQKTFTIAARKIVAIRGGPTLFDIHGYDYVTTIVFNVAESAVEEIKDHIRTVTLKEPGFSEVEFHVTEFARGKPYVFFGESGGTEYLPI